jgi:RNA polymerase sigma-70 factor (ECF subfamily)
VQTRGGTADGELDRLARAARDGDAVAFRELVRATHRLVYRWALVQVGDPDDADDVTQTVLIHLHASLGRWEGRGSFAAWLYRITANESSTWRRALARRRDRSATLRLHGGELDGSAVTGPREVEHVEQLVLKHFRGLPARQRQVFDLVDLQGYEPSEVAEMLALNPNTVRANLFKARRSLRGRIVAAHPHLGRSDG